jgi:hypothetical protein
VTLEWLNDCALNIVFADVQTAKRALNGLGLHMPKIDLNNFEESEFHYDAIKEAIATSELLVDKEWKYTIYLKKEGQEKIAFYILLRMAVNTDTKVDTHSQHRTIRRISNKRGKRGGVVFTNNSSSKKRDHEVVENNPEQKSIKMTDLDEL